MTAGDRVTWLESPRGLYAVAATVESVTSKGRVWIRIMRPSATIPARKLVTAEALKPGWPEREVRWDKARGFVTDGQVALSTLESAEFRLRVKKLVGPSTWGAVGLVLDMAAQVLRDDANS
jgi:hypothetical protein